MRKFLNQKENDMATVRFSKELQDAILNNARIVFNKQREDADNNRPSDEWGDKIYNTLFGEHTAVLNAVPPYFFNMVDKIKVEHIGTLPVNLEFKLNSKRPMPHEFPDTELAKKSGYYGNDIHLKDNLTWGEFHADVTRWKQSIKAVEEKRTAFIMQVKKIIEAHATLAPALKVWPPLWDLVPENYKEKHREVKEREKKEVSLEGVDLSSLTSIVVANKLTR
jgi:hypothetical protein